MKLKDIFIGKLVAMDEPDMNGLPQIGHVVDLDYNYGQSVIRDAVKRGDISSVKVLPVVKFVGESLPRTVNHCNLIEVK